MRKYIGLILFTCKLLFLVILITTSVIVSVFSLGELFGGNAPQITTYPIITLFISLPVFFYSLNMLLTPQNNDKNEWHLITEIPPDMRLIVSDEHGNIAYANPMYCNFKFNENREVIETSMHWQGGWAIEGSTNLSNPIKGKIIGWKYI